jgi:nucleotide-binding universal stress UspA family protein
MERNASGKFLILVGIDFSQDGASVLESAADLASTMLEAELHLVHAFGPAVPADNLRWFPALSDHASIEDSDAAAVALDQLATSIPVRAERVCAYVHEGSATTVIEQVAEDIDADLVVVGGHDRRGVNRGLSGSVAERLVRTAPCPVLIIRRKAIPSADTVMVPCPACEASNRLTWGARDRCLHHAEHQAHVETCGNGQAAMASSI